MFDRRRKPSRASSANYGALLALMQGDRTTFGRLAGTTFSGIEWPYVSVDEINELDAKVRQLDTDVFALEQGPMPTFPSKEWNAWQERGLAINAWVWDWAQWRNTWTAWMDDHYGEFSRFGEEPRKEMDTFIAEYNERLRAFKEVWGEGETGAGKQEFPTEKPGPLDEVIDTGTEALKLVAFFGALYVGVMIAKDLKR